MFTYPIRFYNWTAQQNHLSFLEFLKNYVSKPITEQLITVKISFETVNYAKVILRKDTRKIEFPISYNFLLFQKYLLIAIWLFNNE